MKCFKAGKKRTTLSFNNDGRRLIGYAPYMYKLKLY